MLLRFFIALFLIGVACSKSSDSLPRGGAETGGQVGPQRPAKKQFTVAEKIALIKQCIPSYGHETERSLKRLQAVADECYPEFAKSHQTPSFPAAFELEAALKQFKLDELNESNYASHEPQFIQIIAKYQEIQNTLAYCRTERVKKAAPKVDIDDSLFLHAVGDVFGENSGLEGNQQANTIPYRSKVLKGIQTALKDRVYIEDETQSKPCGGSEYVDFNVLQIGKAPRPDMSQKLFGKLIQQNQNAEELMQVFAGGDLPLIRQTLQKQLDQLAPGESAYLPAGWTMHAVLYQFTKEQNGNYRFRIFNSGEGIGEYHLKVQTGLRQQYFPFAEITDVHPDRITSFVFLKALQEIRTPGIYGSKPSDFYQKLLVSLDGKPEQAAYDAKLFRDPQQAGTCTYFPTSWLMSSSVGQFASNEAASEAAAQIEFMIGLKTIQNFSDPKRDWNENSLSLLRKGLVFFSESAARDYMNHVVDYGALLSVAEEGTRVKKDVIEVAEVKLEADRARDARRFDPTNVEFTALSGIKDGLRYESEIRAGTQGREAKVPTFNLNADLESLYQGLFDAVFVKRYEWSHDRIYLNKDAEVVVNAIEQLALMLSLSSSAWSQKNPKDTIELLAKISKLYSFVLLKQVQDKRRDPDKIYPISYLTSLKLLTVADLINQKFVNDIKPKIPSMYQPRAGLILSGMTSVFEVSDPKWQHQMELLRKHYAPEKDQKESFFGFEKFPAGAQGDTRRFYDDPQAATSLKPEDKSWSIPYQYTWPDYLWVKQWIADNHISVGNTRSPDPYISDFSYSCLCAAPQFKPHPILPSLDRASETVLSNRKAILVLAVQSDPRLPQTFYALRDLSALTDFMLSGRWNIAVGNLNFGAGVSVEMTRERNSFSASTTKHSCTCDNRNYRDIYDQRGNYVGQDRVAPFEKIENAHESTFFNQYNLSYKIFGATLESAKDKQFIAFSLDETNKPKGVYVSPWVNLKESNRPFAKFQSTLGLIQQCTDQKLKDCEGKNDQACKDLRTNCKPLNEYHFTELLQIWSLGQNRALELLDPAEAPQRYRVAPNEYILRKPTDLTASKESFTKLSLERLRNLMGIGGFPELQIKATLDFFTKYPELNNFPEYQVLFEKLMMEPGLMLDQLRISDKDSRLFVRQLKAFCDAQYEVSAKYYDYQSIAFITHMQQLFQEQILFARTLSDGHMPDDILGVLADAPERLYAVIRDLKPEQLAEKNFLYRNLAEMFLYAPSLNARQMELLLLAVIEYRATPQQDPAYQDPHGEEMIRNLLVKQHENIQMILENQAARNQILTAIANIIRPDVSSSALGAWVQNGSIYSAGIFQIDVLNGALYDGGNPRVLFPIDSRTFSDVFAATQKAPSHAVRIGLDSYEWTFENGSKAKSQKTGVGYTFQQEINGTWYQFMDNADLKIFEGSKLRMSGFRYWRSLDGTKVRLINPETGITSYQAELEGTKVKQVVRESDKAQLIDTTFGSSYRVFGQIEDWNHVYIWRSAAEKMLEVELPRLKLSFKPNVSGNFNCADETAYQVAELQYVPELGNPVFYLVCELKTKKDKKLVLMPPNQLVSPGESLTPNFGTEHGATHVMYYEVDPVTGLSRSTEESRYYLALRKLFKREYRDAAAEIRRTSIELAPLEEGEERVVSWLIAGNGFDHDPRAYAVRLLAAYWKSKHEQYCLGKFEFPHVKLYSDYLRKVHRVDTSILGIHEEEKMAQAMDFPERVHQLRAEGVSSTAVFENADSEIIQRADNILGRESLEKLFVQNFEMPKLSQPGVLKPAELFTENTFPLMYQIASGEDFNETHAKQLLAAVLNANVGNLSKAEIRQEFTTLMHMASISGTGSESQRARFLESVLKTRPAPMLSDITEDIQNLDALRRQEKDANAAWWKAYTDAKGEYPYPAHVQRLSDEKWRINAGIQKREQKLQNTFISIKNNDLEPVQYAKPNIQPGTSPGPFTGTKNPIIPEVPADIAAADIPLAQVVIEDPLREPIFADPAITIKPLSGDAQAKVIAEGEQLQQVLNRSQNRAVQVLKTKISAQAKSVAETKRFYENPNWKLFKVPDLKAREEQRRQLYTKIMDLGQRYAPDFKGGAFNRVLHLADVGKELSIDDLIYLLMKRNMTALYQAQGALKLEELNKLYQDLIRYMMLTTYLGHVQRLSKAIDIAKACSPEQSPDCQTKLGNAVELAKTKRNYAVGEHIEYLIFEHFMDLLIRPSQVEALNQLQIKNGEIHNQKALGGLLEMIMGAGKTSVLLPLLSTLDNSGKWMNMIVLPEALVTSMSKELSRQLDSAFGRNVLVLNISRQRYLAGRDLQLVLERLERARQQNQTVVTTNGAIQSLFLSFIDRLQGYEKNPNQNGPDLLEFSKIFRFLRQYGRLTIDEVDLALDILQAHQFSVGSPQPLINNTILKTYPIVAFSLYHEIAINKALNQVLDFPFLRHHRGKEAFTAGSYAAFKSQLVDAILRPQFLKISEDLGRLYNPFVQDQAMRALARAYLLSDKAEQRSALMKAIGNDRLKDVFAVMYEEINHVLPLTAVRKVGVHYGKLIAPERKSTETQDDFNKRWLTYKNSKLIAIPYHSGEPMVNSRFGTPLEALNYTLQLALHEGGYETSVQQEIESLKAMIRSNSPNLRNGIFKERLRNLVGDSKFNVMQATKKDVEQIFNGLQQPTRLQEQLELDWHYVVPQVKFNEKQLMTNAQVYQSLFAFIQGFSGTLWSAETFPKIFQNPIMSDTPEKTFLIVWQDYLTNKKPLLILNDASSYLDQVYGGGFKGSLMDEAGIFRGHSNYKIAGDMMSKTHRKVAFYDDKNNLMSCCDSAGQPMVLKNKAPEPNLVAFWDKKHTTGSDIKLMPDMTSAMTIDFYITSRSFQQTVWRLRGLGNGQVVSTYAALVDDINVMKDRLNNEWHVNPEAHFALGDLILYSVLNEDTKLAELKFRAMKQKMKNVVIGQVLNQIFADGVGPASLYQVYGQARNLFEMNTGVNSLYETNGLPVQVQKTSQAIQDVEQGILKSSYMKGLDEAHIKNSINKLKEIELPLLPANVKYSDKEDGTEIEIETETEQEQEQEKEEEREDFSAFREHAPHQVMLWDLNADSLSDRYFQTQWIAALERTGGDIAQLHLPGAPVVLLREALEKDKLRELARYVSPDLQVSLNFAPIHFDSVLASGEKVPYAFEFFGPYHKPLHDLLLVQDNSTGKFTAIMIDDNDAKQWDAFLRTSHAIGENRVALYNLATGHIYRSSVQQIDADDIPKDILVEAGFLAGHVNYPHSQEAALKQFLGDEKRAKSLLAFFKRDILRYQRDSAKAFRGSMLERLLIEILGSVD